MKVSKLSLISLSLLLACQATMPMENSASSVLKKAQKAGKIALKIGAGTATLGMCAFMGTAALTSLGLTLGAAAALPYLYYARFIKPKLAIPAANPALNTPELPEIKAKEGVTIKKPQFIPQKSQKPTKNRATALAKTALKSAGIMGALVVEDDTFDAETISKTHLTREQAMQAVKDSATTIQAQLAECHEQNIQWQKEHSRARIMEFPRYEGAYQDMIGVIDGDIQDVADAARNRMHADLASQWQQAGCKDKQDKLAGLARRMQQDSMRLPKL